MAGTDLVPGDIVSIGRYVRQDTETEESIPADMLILEGSLIVSESILTGESIPQLKVLLFFNFLPSLYHLLVNSLHKNVKNCVYVFRFQLWTEDQKSICLINEIKDMSFFVAQGYCIMSPIWSAFHDVSKFFSSISSCI